MIGVTMLPTVRTVHPLIFGLLEPKNGQCDHRYHAPALSTHIFIYSILNLSRILAHGGRGTVLVTRNAKIPRPAWVLGM